jgi:CubicO group peptidase (beta-lactamase class C family)
VLRTTISHALLLVLVVMASVGCAHPSRFPLHAVYGDQFSLSAAPPDPPAPPAIEGNSDRERFDALVADWRSRLAEAGVPGGAIAVVIDGKLAFTTGVGVTRAGDRDAVTPQTMFRLA